MRHKMYSIKMIPPSLILLLAATTAVFAQQLNAPLIESPSGDWEGQVSETENILAPDAPAPVVIPDVGKTTQCSDGRDNDKDGKIDLADPDCYGPADNNESPSQCSDKKDNDKDGKVDLADSDCDDKTDEFEGKSQCSDKGDNDNDGQIDLADSGCKNGESDNFEGDSQCSDEKDNDKDGFIDMADFGCKNGEADDFEGDSQCSDEKDNDKDGQIDLTDSDCSSEADNFEGSFDVLVPRELKPKMRSAIDNLEIKPEKILSPIFSGVVTLEVNPSIEDDKVIYQLEPVVNTPIYSENELIRQPLLDLNVNQPVEFRLSDNKIIVNNEQIIDYKSIVGGNELIPLVELKIHSALRDGKIYDLIIVSSKEVESFKFVYKDKEVNMPIYSDFKVENQKISLLHDGQVYDLRVLPNEMYTGIYSPLEAGESGKDIEVKDLSVKIMDKKAVYDLKVKEPFKLFWLIPMKIDSGYIIDSDDGFTIKKIKPWWTIFGNDMDYYNNRVYVLG